MGEFKKFISTSGKTFDEIKKTINELVNRAVDNVVDTVVNDVTEFAPKELRREVKRSVKEVRRKAAEGSYRPEKLTRALSADSADDKERLQLNGEYEPGDVFTSDLSYGQRIYYPHESRSADMTDHEEFILSKIEKMRELELGVRGKGIIKRAVELTLAEQGRFMSDVEDDFPRRAFCALPQPVYAAMSNSQLRTFFTWRTDVRRGTFNETDKPYVMLYCFELLNKVNGESSVEAFEKLLETWEHCRGFAPYLNRFMPRWLKDFYAFNDVTEKYPDINSVLGKPDESGLRREFSEIEAGEYSGKLDFLAENSAYDIKGSAFYSKQTHPLIEAALEHALHALDGYFSARDIELSELVCGKLKKDYSWVPFKDAIVNLDTTEGFRAVKISAAERYCVKRGEPALEMFDFAPSKGFIGYLLKSVEARLRINTGFGRRIIPKEQMLQNDLKNRTRLMAAVSAPEFTKIIPRAVDEYCAKNGIRPAPKRKPYDDAEFAEYVAPKVEIDVSKLEEIRGKSDEIARKLILDEAESGELDEALTPQEQRPSRLHDVAEQERQAALDSAAQIDEDEFSERIEEYKEELSPNEEELPLQSGNPVFEELDSDWQSFANELIPSQIEVLKALLEGNVRTYCCERDILPETAFEEINTLSLDAFGDVVIECGALVEDYAEDIAKIVRAAGGG